MAQRNAFHALTAGVAFSRRKHGAQMKLFEKEHDPVHVPVDVDVDMDSSKHSGKRDRARSTSTSEAKAKARSGEEKAKGRKRKSRSKKEVESDSGGESESGNESGELRIMAGAGLGGGGAPHKLRKTLAQGDRKDSRTSQHWEEMQALRHKHRIRVEGNSVPDPILQLSDLFPRYTCPQHLLDNMGSSGYTTATPIQMQAIPVMLEGRELLGCAPTGSGKTLSFMVPLICYCHANPRVGSASGSGSGSGSIRCVVVSPTRELAHQTYQEFVRMIGGGGDGNGTSCNVVYLKVKGKAATPGVPVDILIATPMRLVKAIKRDPQFLAGTERLILDEADKLFEFDFLTQIDKIVAACTNTKRVVSLFSATMQPQVEDLARAVLRDPIRVIIGHRNVAAAEVKQKLMFVGREEGKRAAIRQLLHRGGLRPPILVFVQSKERAADLYQELLLDQVNVGVIHSDLTQAEREEVVRQFRLGRVWVLIATDLFARGMDFKGVNCVVNYDFPQSTVSYIHRIGRTGRAGRPGEAVTFFTEDDAEFLRPIANIMRDSGCEVPEYMLSIQPPTKARKRKIERRPLHRTAVSASGLAADLVLEKKRKKEAMRRKMKRKHQAAVAKAKAKT